jgi:hypothetical protein
MTSKPKTRLLGSILLGGWLSLTSCTHLSTSSTKQAEADSALQSVTNRLYLDISYAQDIAQRAPHMPAPDGPIPYEYGTNARHKAYQFANLQAFRLDIKRRMDSLRVAGRVLSYDTLVTGQGPVGKLKVD